MWSGSFSQTKLERRALRALIVLVAAAGVGAGCSGRSTTQIVPPEQSGTGGTGGSGTGGSGFAGRGGQGGMSAGRDAGKDADAGEDDPYVDPGCPSTPAPEGVRECDIFSMPSGCPEGTGCYPDLVHPYGVGCDQQTLNLVCRVAGTGVEGDLCGAGTEGCAPGFTCIVGAESGKRCLRICNPKMGLFFEPGAICGDTDARGIGVCS
jgi:hypothetical protein